MIDICITNICENNNYLKDVEVTMLDDFDNLLKVDVVVFQKGRKTEGILIEIKKKNKADLKLQLYQIFKYLESNCRRNNIP